MPFKPSFPGEVPTLGWHVLDWFEANLAEPDSIDYRPFRPTREQAEFILKFYELDPITGARVNRRGVISRPRGWGKALALDTELPTPDGWTTMAEVAVGDILFDEHGAPCHVIAKTPVWHDTDCYRVTFSDGQEFVASGEHLWTVDEIGGRSGVTLRTRDMAARVAGLDRAAYRITSPEPLDLGDRELPIDPYMLGVWLGDGNAADGRITTPDEEIVERCRRAGYQVEKRDNLRWQVFGLVTRLNDLGLVNNKHIPGIYLRAGTDQRWSLMQGLMDTDGSVYDQGVCEYTTCSPALARDVSDLLASLGVKHAVYRGTARLDGRDIGPKWRIKYTVHDDSPVVMLPRKAARLRPARRTCRLFASRRIVAIEPVPTVPTVCITVDSSSSLFLAGRKMTPTHNSPFVAAICIAEALADVAFDGWDANGQPVGQPWVNLKTPLVALAAATEDQVQNSWIPLQEMLDPEVNPPVFENYPGLEVMNSFVNLPRRGRIFPITTSGSSAKGMRTVLTVADQTEVWNTGNGGHKFMRILLDNAAKRGGALIETPNAYTPGEDSVAERSAEAFFAIAEGRARSTKGLIYDHREALPETDLTDRDSLIAGLRYCYGDSSAHPDGCVLHDPPCAPGWVDLDVLVSRIWDQDADEQDSRANFLNQITHATDAYISGPEWAGVADETMELRKGDVIALGFDGSRGRAKGKPDASALVACRVSDGFTTLLWIDEAKDDDKHRWATWEPNIVELEAVLADTFRTYRVAGAAMDPGRDWRSHINAWEAKYGSKVVVKRTGNHPFEWWMTGGRATAVEKAVEQFEGAVRNGDLRHDNSAALTRHVLNARRRIQHKKLALGKESEYSTRKIDACVAAVLAWQARADALSAGAAIRRKSSTFGRIGTT